MYYIEFLWGNIEATCRSSRWRGIHVMWNLDRPSITARSRQNLVVAVKGEMTPHVSFPLIWSTFCTTITICITIFSGSDNLKPVVPTYEHCAFRLIRKEICEFRSFVHHLNGFYHRLGHTA